MFEIEVKQFQNHHLTFGNQLMVLICTILYDPKAIQEGLTTYLIVRADIGPLSLELLGCSKNTGT